ncbi:putative DDE superfamily endonuclease [Monocercomonoides exilis]|uniref:putative DDE superfamily endonuclease n=1 Tax=Monocercomonoides exilis TaxID=2049356 RepID=UPI00355A8E84|nr:putative DDE superfamily endonuclease [Monocercomonoides exilis]|eukprot:MONOS_13657.1-p1 / transcript=MONOS_13657.1 / gene=MONOS_13657 / organism=Monocercomonoides_exilis_PA203 / gene_product=unspecified product / transcript_product=unspecified product / location=Mono_scaffold00859:13325-14447(-) / protein_length=265 / sequence_SO=supercontig / SO=protein_coding / is_pseudo=false
MKAKVISKDAWKRGIRAEKAGREVGRNGHPQTFTDYQLETIENQVLVLLSNQTIVRIRDVQNMVVCFKDQTPPCVPTSPKVLNTAIYLCVCTDESSLTRFLLNPKKTLPKKFHSLSSFNIRYVNSSPGWITKEIFRHIMINYCIPFVEEKVKLTSSLRALLLMDNHSTHNDGFVIEAAEKDNIILKRFPPNMTHLLQPCDSRIFSRLKSTLNNKFVIPSPFSLSSYRTQLTEVLPEALAAACTHSTIKAAFIKTGVWPVAAAPVL